MKVLLLEDDIELSDILSDFLEEKGHEVIICSRGEVALEFLIEGNFDFAILDINTPNMSGIDVLKHIREDYKSQTPIIIMTAYKELEILGKKYFNLDELEQKINRLCKYFSQESDENINISKDISFTPSECLISLKNVKIHMAQKERDILQYLLSHKGKVVSLEELESIWDEKNKPTENEIKNCIDNLKEIIGNEKIDTIKDIGYKFI